MNALYPGSFDPLTLGHYDIIERASAVFDKVFVGVLVNESKKSMFNLQERIEMIEEATKELGNIFVFSFEGLLVDLFNKLDIHVIIKGLRAVADFEYEWQMALMNRSLNPEAETMFFMASSQYQNISSSLIKEIYRLGGNVEPYVPVTVYKRLQHKQEEK